MRIALHLRREARHQQLAGGLLAAGIKRHGLTVEEGVWSQPSGADVCVVWSWKQTTLFEDCKRRGARVLVLERGYMGDRMAWYSLAVDGLNGRGRFPEPQDDGARFRRHFADLLRPWRDAGDWALLIGQVPGDAQLMGMDPVRWAADTAAALTRRGHAVRFRPHPICVARGTPTPTPVACSRSEGPLGPDLARAYRCVTFNSNTGVEAVLAGVPTVCLDPLAMAAPVAAGALEAPAYMPDRTEWCRAMAWRQWLADELVDGTAWEAIRSCLT